MNPKRSNPLDVLKDRITRLDGQAVDELYGLEPVYEPGADACEGGLGEFVELQCPYCGEVSGSRFDLTHGSRVCIEDCHVCCQPIEVTLDVHLSGVLLGASTARLDD